MSIRLLEREKNAVNVHLTAEKKHNMGVKMGQNLANKVLFGRGSCHEAVLK